VLDVGKLDPERVIDFAKRSKDLKAEFLNDYQPTNPALVTSQVGTEANAALLKLLTD